MSELVENEREREIQHAPRSVAHMELWTNESVRPYNSSRINEWMKASKQAEWRNQMKFVWDEIMFFSPFSSSFIFCVVTSRRKKYKRVCRVRIYWKPLHCVVLTTIFLSEHKTLMILLSAPKTTLMDELSEILIYHRFLYLVVFPHLSYSRSAFLIVASDVSSH